MKVVVDTNVLVSGLINPDGYPGRIWNASNPSRKDRREYALANGNKIGLAMATADIEFQGEVLGGTIVFGEEDAEPLLGVTELESGGFEVDPRNQELKRLPAVLLK